MAPPPAGIPTDTSLWLGEAPASRSAPLPATADVAIIGAGIAGIATALHLAERGASVAVLEREAVASRASGRNDGQLLLGLGEHYHRIHGQLGAARARCLWDFLERNHERMLAAVAAAGVQCELEVQGGLRLAETEHEWHELQAAASALAAEGRRHHLVSAEEVRDWVPAAHGFHGALHLPGEAIVQPVRLVRGLADLAAARGAQLVTGAEVQGIDGDAGGFRVALADGRSLEATAVVHCASALAPGLDASGLLRRVLFPFRGQIIATDPLPAELAAGFPAAAMSSNFCYEYFRLSRGRFVLGGMRWSVRGEELGITDDGSHHPEVTANLRAYAHRHFPCLRDIAFPHVWTGIMAGTPDGLPLCGALPGRPGTFALCGFNGYGLSFAFLAGQCLAELIVDGHSGETALAMFAPRRFAAG